MSKLNDAIYEIDHLSEIAQQDQWINCIHPLVKFLLTILYIFIVVSFPKYNVSGLLSMAMYPLILFIVSDLSFKDALHRLRIVLPLVCVVGILNPFFDREVYSTIGSFQVTGGMLSMITLMGKGIFTVLASYILIATTTIEKICYAMRLIHVPKIMVTQILLIYRYIRVLLSEVKRITQAYSLRAPNQKGIHFKAWGSLVGQLLLRSMDRADIVYESMCLRGYNGEFDYGSISFQKSDAIYLIFWVALFIVCRLFPVFEWVGGLFI